MELNSIMMTIETTFNFKLLNTMTIPPRLIENRFENLDINKKHWITHAQYNAVTGCVS